MMPAHLVLAIQAVASGAMCGIIWFVQVVHYPLFARGGDERAHALENQRRTAWVVIPFMLVEGLAATLLAWAPPPGVPRAAAVGGLAVVAALWLSTALVQMPLHARLAREGHRPDVVAALVRSNRTRTALWSLRAVLAAWMLVAAARVVVVAGPPAAALPESPPMPASPAPPTVKPFGTLADGREARLYVLEVPGGWRAEITDYGAILTRFLVPTADGPPVDVVLGFDDLAGYLAGHPYFGAICGRVSNRIAGGIFDLDGRTCTLATNDGANHLHGGAEGFDKRLWKGTPRLSARGPAVDFEMISPDGDQGYPGRLAATVTYTLALDGALWVEMSATADAPTVVNLVHHSYWNLAGHGSGSIRDHELAVHADRYLPVDAGSIPTGEQRAVADTPFDFRPERRPAAGLGAAIDGLPAAADGTNPGGVDHDFVVRGWRPDGALRSVAELRDPRSGRTLEIISDQPGLQVYTGNHLDGTLRGKGGATYARHAGICLETQLHPDSVHHPEWPSPRLDPGSTYRHTLVHRFRTR